MVKISKAPTGENEREEVPVTILLSIPWGVTILRQLKYFCTTAKHLVSLEEINTSKELLQ